MVVMGLVAIQTQHTRLLSNGKSFGEVFWPVTYSAQQKFCGLSVHNMIFFFLEKKLRDNAVISPTHLLSLASPAIITVAIWKPPMSKEMPHKENLAFKRDTTVIYFNHN